MKVEQFVMAYKVEQDRLRALLPKAFESLRPVLRINAEIRSVTDTDSGLNNVYYIEFNTPVTGYGKRGWFNIANWSSSDNDISVYKNGRTTTFKTPFLEISYTAIGITGGCPAEKDNDGCFYSSEFIPAEKIDAYREFCNCRFAWKFNKNDANGISTEGKSIPAFASESEITYKKEAPTPENAAKIPCQQVLGSYSVIFNRQI